MSSAVDIQNLPAKYRIIHFSDIASCSAGKEQTGHELMATHALRQPSPLQLGMALDLLHGPWDRNDLSCGGPIYLEGTRLRVSACGSTQRGLRCCYLLQVKAHLRDISPSLPLSAVLPHSWNGELLLFLCFLIQSLKRQSWNHLTISGRLISVPSSILRNSHADYHNR